MFYDSKAIFFKVLEVPGEDLETLSETKAGKGALERRLRLSFCRFGQIFEILRVPLGGNFWLKSDVFSDSIFDDFLMNFGVTFGRGRRQGRTSLSLQNLRVRQESGKGINPLARPVPLWGGGGSEGSAPAAGPSGNQLTADLQIRRISRISKICRIESVGKFCN